MVSRSPGVSVSCLWGAWPGVRVICPGCLATPSGAPASPRTPGPSRGWRPGPGHQLRRGTPRQPEAMTSPAGRPGPGRTPETFSNGSTRTRVRKKKMTSSMKSIRENHSTVFLTNSPEFYSLKNQLMIEFQPKIKEKKIFTMVTTTTQNESDYCILFYHFSCLC